MKAEKVFGIAACVFACAMGSAFANTTNSWFGVAPNGTDIGLASVTTNGAVVTVDNGVIQLDNELETALTFTPTDATPALSDGLVTIMSSAVLTPSDASDLVPVAGAHAGFAVAVDGSDTNFYGYASAGSSSGDPKWIKFTNVLPVDPETTATAFTIALNYRDSKVSFYQGSNLLTDGTDSEFSISNNFTSLSNVSAYGTGSISSITSEYEVAVAAYNNKKYGSGAEAVKAKGSGSGDISDIAPNGAISSDPLAANGLYAWECDVLGVAPNANIPFKPAAAVNDHITLQVASEIESGIQATFKVYTKSGGSWVEGNEYPSNAIQLPTEASGKYQIKPAAITAQ